MLIGTVIIFIVSHFLPERPAGIPRLLDLLPGMLLIHPAVINAFFQVEVNALENVFWSLFVEVKFYLIFGFLYFYNKNKVLQNSVALFLIPFLYHVATYIFQEKPVPILMLIFYDILSLSYFGWFVIGALLYKSYSNKDRYATIGAMLLFLPAALQTEGLIILPLFACCLIFGIFYLTIFNAQFKRIFSNQAIVFFGFISYPLYLIHESLMISLTVKTHNEFPWLSHLLTPIPGLAAIVLLSLLIAKYLEPLLRNGIKSFLR
jgi:peptidoglycan/LPS O-acetylase OafA/YrhL